MGIRDFNVAHHQPHPPGYPVYMLIAKAVHRVVPSDVTVLALMSVIGGALGVLALGALYRRLDAGETPASWSAAALAVTMTTPLYWFTAARPLSDACGLAAALAVQAMTLGATTPGGFAVAAFCAGLAAGVRSQAVWLTVPLIALRAIEGLRAEGSGLRRVVQTGVAFVAGVALWFLPLIYLSGGAIPYWHALFDQGAADLENIQMLWTSHGLRDLRDAAYFALVAPWATWTVAAVVLVCAALGVLALLRDRRAALLTLAAAFGPYLVFDLLFQETFTSRYALPLVVPMAYLAVSGLRLVPRNAGLAVAVVIALFDLQVGGMSIAAYAGAKAPVFRMLDDMRIAAASAPQPPVLAMDQREASDMRGPRKFLGTAMPAVSRALPSPPRHEWLEAVTYWNGGGRAPVWFVVDPRRTTIDLVQHGEPLSFRWTIRYPVLLGGVRPNDMNWYRVERPDWYLGEGWSLTPETAGVAENDRRGLAHEPIEGWISRESLGGVLMIGGRSFDPVLQPRLTVRVAGVTVVEDTLAPGGFLRMARLPADTAPGDYREVTIETTPPAPVAIEQFDASSTRALIGFGGGWHEQEYDPPSGLRWRWLSERGELRIQSPGPQTVHLHLAGESPRAYFSRGSHLIVRAGARMLIDQTLSSDFSLDATIALLAGEQTITLETDQVFSPADRSSRSQDRRHLGLRIVDCGLRITK